MRTKKGLVTAANMQRTVTVTVHRSMFHPKYKKRFRMSKKFLVDAGDKQVRVGDLVLIEECRPLSKRKRFRLSEILQSGPVVSEMAEETALTGVLKTKPAGNEDMHEGASESSSRAV